MPLSFNEELKKFLTKYDVRIVDDNRRRNKMVPFHINSKIEDPYTAIYGRVETEKIYTIEIPESDLHDLLEFHHRVEESIKRTGSMDVFEYFLKEKDEERNIRNTYSAVKKAYDQYQMLLKLAQSGDIDA